MHKFFGNSNCLFTHPFDKLHLLHRQPLGHPARIRILELLVQHDQQVSQLLEQIDLEPSSLSQPLAVLKNTGLVEPSRKGNSVTYTVTDGTTVNTYTVTATAGTNGSVSPAGASAENYGDNQTITITPATGYHVADVLIDGISAGAVTSHTFSNITADHTIAASFAVNNYTVTYVGGTHFNDKIDIKKAVDAAKDQDVIVLCLGEKPYTETMGNIPSLSLEQPQVELANALFATGKPVVLVTLGGRPRIITEQAEKASAVLLGF